MSAIFGYLLVGCAMYCAIVHFSMQSDYNPPEGVRWVIIAWPIVYLLGIFDLIDWIVKECRKNE